MDNIESANNQSDESSVETSYKQNVELPASSTRKLTPPIEKGVIDLFIFLGICVAIFGVILGIYTISQAPKYAFSTEAKAISNAAWFWGIMQILSGILTGFFFYVIGKIGYAVIDIWREVKNK